MSTLRTPLIAGNWKMNLDHLQAIANVQKLAWSLEDAGHKYDEVEVLVCPPFTDLRSTQTLISADRLDIKLGAQDLSPHDEGAYTGDISGVFLSKLDINYVLIGHSERRAIHSENNETVSNKIVAAHRNNLVPILCVGETAEDRAEHGPATSVLEQLEFSLKNVAPDKELVIAYEPVWAIGTGQAATPEQAEEVIAKIRHKLATLYSADFAKKTRILYGGSVTSNNIASLMKQTNIDGALVGGASLKPEEFSKIIQYKKHVVA